MRKKFLIFSIVCLLFCTLSYTYSSFKNTIVGNISGNIKDWVFKVSIDNSTKYEDGYKLHLTGTSGSFNININTVGGASGADYSIELIGDSSIKYYTDSSYTNLISNNIYNGSINSNTSNSVTIYYKSDNNINDDIHVKTKGSIMEYAMMINHSNYIGEYEFWSTTYKPYIRIVEFENDLSNLPSDCTEENLCWDISYDKSQKKKVYGYLTDSGLKDSTDNTKVLYNLYIVSDGKIFAPFSSSTMFNKFKNLTQINFNNNFDTSKATGMSSMFKYCSSLTSLNLSDFNTTNVTYMNNMFCGCSSLTSLDLSSFNTSNVTNMNYMFYGCSSLTNLELSSFNTSNVINMGSMFQNCSSLTSLNLSSFNTSNTTAMYYMFQNCSSLTSMDLSSFNTSRLILLNNMFYGCSKLTTTINLMNTDISKYSYIFTAAATDSNAQITVNYIADLDIIAEGETKSLIDNIIAAKWSNSNVIKGSIITEYSITINGNEDIKYESINRLEDAKVTLTSISGNNYVTSFKMNGTTISGNEFTMPGSNVTITDIVTVPCKTIETAHFPYPDSQDNVVLLENTFEEATSLTVLLEYQLQSGYNNDYFCIYDSNGLNIRRDTGGGSGVEEKWIMKTETITITSNYIKITFTSNSSDNNYYGLKAIVIPNY